MDEGVIIPSYMSIGDRGALMDMGNQSDTSLRFGEVKAIVYPEDAQSISKRFIEYTVNIHHKDNSGPGSTQVYSGCVVSNPFGLGGDLIRYTLRADPIKTSSKGAQVGIGAKVLLLCINGDRPRAVIIGGLRDQLTQPDSKAVDKKEDGHNLRFQFNGLSASINKDGEFSLIYGGPSDAKGVLNEGFEKGNTTATFSFTKDGSTKWKNSNTENILLDHPNNKIVIAAKSEILAQTDGDWNVAAQGEATLQAKKSIDLKTDNGCTVSASNIKLGSSGASEHLILGDTYRQGESTMVKALSSDIQTLATSLSTLNIAVTVAGTALKVPITGGILASPSFAAMSVQLVLMGQTIMKMMTDLNTFESGTSSYLSSDHTTE